MAGTINRAIDWTYGLTPHRSRYTKLEEDPAEADPLQQPGRHRYTKYGDGAEEDPLLVAAAASAAAGARHAGGGGGGRGRGRQGTAVKWLGVLAVLAVSAVACVKKTTTTMLSATTTTTTAREDRAAAIRAQQSSENTDGNSYIALFEVLSILFKQVLLYVGRSM